MKKKIALIFGITGQDGAYLSELLLKKNYVVNGVIRRSSSFNTGRIDHLYQDPHEKNRNFILHYGDVTDSISVSSLIKKINPDEIYNLAAQSHVAVSFEVPEYTANADAIGALRILEAIKFHGFEKKTKFYQAGTSEMFGKTKEKFQNELNNYGPKNEETIKMLLDKIKDISVNLENNMKVAILHFCTMMCIIDGKVDISEKDILESIFNIFGLSVDVDLYISNTIKKINNVGKNE